jgi:ABC-type Na+ transport system ATPase subunit NatA
MTPNPMPAIETIGLTRWFGQTRAVDGVNLSVPDQSVYGLLGPNGAGKTTMIRMLATLLRPHAGTARVFGYDVVRDADAVRRHLSLTGQFASLDADLTCVENLVLLSRLLGYSRRDARCRAGELLEAYGLVDAGRRRVMNLSGGMRRRLDIAASLIVRPDLLFLDEPTTGLDPRGRPRDAFTESNSEHRPHRTVPSHLREQRFRRAHDHALVAAHVRRYQPDFPSRDGRARADGRNCHNRPGCLGPPGRHCPDDAVRPAHDAPVPQQGMNSRHRLANPVSPDRATVLSDGCQPPWARPLSSASY